MKDIDQTLYERVEHADGRIEFIPKKEYPILPNIEGGYFVRDTGGVMWIHTKVFLTPLAHHHNLFSSEEEAEKASKLMRRSNAIIRACLLVDPDFEPDWGNREQNKYFLEYHTHVGEWYVETYTAINCSAAYVSTYDKAEEVCKILTAWGIK